MKKRYSFPRIIASVFCLSLLMTSFMAVPASANSALTQWTGTSSTGAIVMDGDCPIIVEKELLVFDLMDFPAEHYKEVDDYLAYSGKVSAEYTFYNPADHAVAATLLFPFGTLPDYGWLRDAETDEQILRSDTMKYDITVDNTPIEKTLRHTLSLYGSQFELENDMARLHDGYMKDTFYSPDMLVTRYTYMAEDVDVESYNAATAAFILRADATKTKVLMENQSGGKLLDDAVLLDTWVDMNETVIVNVIGQPLTQMPEWKFYENGACEKEIGGTMVLTGVETTTLREFALSEYDEESEVLDYDWYNAVIASMQYHEWEYGALHGSEIHFGISDALMRWYEYEITVAPGERIVNTVEAPMYPSIDTGYEPPIYQYIYLLSPAKTWADFGTLDIVVNTASYMTASNLEGFEETEGGYAAQLPGLPDCELEFTLCAEKTPEKPNYSVVFPWTITGICIAVLVSVSAFCLFLIRRMRKHRKGVNEKQP